MNLSPVSDFRKAYEAAPHRFESMGVKVAPEDLEFQAYTQVWNTAACGFPAKDGAAPDDSPRKALTVVVSHRAGLQVLVYIGGRFAWRLAVPAARFYRLLASGDLPGATGDWRSLETAACDATPAIAVTEPPSGPKPEDVAELARWSARLARLQELPVPNENLEATLRAAQLEDARRNVQRYQALVGTS